jgi:hypothetical protein
MYLWIQFLLDHHVICQDSYIYLMIRVMKLLPDLTPDDVEILAQWLSR